MVSLRYDDDLICIGSGSIDQYAAIQAAILGKRAVLGERRKTVGGVCVESGTILGKTFREAVLSFNSMTRHFEGHERCRYQRRAIAIQLLARVEAVMRRDVDVVVGQMRRNDVTLFHSDASFNDPSIVMVTTEDGNRSITAANTLIAVEARPCVGGRRHLRRRNDSSSGDVPRLNQLHGSAGWRHHWCGVRLHVRSLGQQYYGPRQTGQTLGVPGFKNCGGAHPSDAKPL